MAAQRQYATAGAFRTALEARLNEQARRDGVDLHRLRRQVAFDRLLARMFDRSQPIRDGWVLKGGYALEMRFHMARSTKDLDLTVRSAPGPAGDSTSLRERLQIAASNELPDFFTFIVGEAMAELNQAPEGGARFPVDARLDGRTFVKFHVDLGVGDEVLEPLESIEGEDWLGFAGIPAVVVPALSVEQHWAEKFHAYTRPRETPNSRVRDLVDLVLILEHQAPGTERVRAAVDATFQRRKTHSVPDVVPGLRIIDDEVWQAVQTRYATVQRKWKAGQEGRRFNQFRRPKYLFSGLTKCGECGAGFIVYSREQLGCFGTRDRGDMHQQADDLAA